MISNSLREEVQVTVIATGFGGQARRRTRRREGAIEPPIPAGASTEGFDVSHDLEVPSFLRDD